VKPYKSRWPEGRAFHKEQTNPFHDNVQYPKEFDPESVSTDADESLYKALTANLANDEDGLHTDRMVVNIGPQHPSTHGVFRMSALLEG